MHCVAYTTVNPPSSLLTEAYRGGNMLREGIPSKPQDFWEMPLSLINRASIYPSLPKTVVVCVYCPGKIAKGALSHFKTF